MGRRVLITGGAGFVGSGLAVALAGRHPDWQVVALDNLYRAGSELNLERLEQADVEFVRGDVRFPDQLEAAGHFDALIECSAEPSVMSGVEGDTRYLVETNLDGAHNCLELARHESAQFIFLSSSRVYPVETLASANLTETATRFELDSAQEVPGLSGEGVSEQLPMTGRRTLYGATKLAAELLIEEYGFNFSIPTTVNRCGVIAGPWQMGKVDQGVFTHWMMAHCFDRPLSYIGFGGAGKQVRDLIHIDDLVDLIERQLLDPGHWDGLTFNIGGGRQFSLSLAETSAICVGLTGREVEIRSEPETRAGDIPVYLSDCRRLFDHTDWRPVRDPQTVLSDIHDWIEADRERLSGVLPV
jgi:CDP-paratose 2-epimerase